MQKLLLAVLILTLFPKALGHLNKQLCKYRNISLYLMYYVLFQLVTYMPEQFKIVYFQ